jgi:hypothetical protein
MIGTNHKPISAIGAGKLRRLQALVKAMFPGGGVFLRRDFMKVFSEIACRCGCKTRVKYVRPQQMGETVGTFSCSGCGSRLQFWAKRQTKQHVKIKTRYLEMSSDLEALVREDLGLPPEGPIPNFDQASDQAGGQ